MSDIMSLIDFWRLQRRYNGLKTIVKKFHKTKAQALEDLVLGRIPTPNLAIVEPPRVGKTDLGVKAFEPWATSYFPDSEWINSSNSGELATENTKYVRDTFNAQWYRDMVGTDWGAVVKAERKDGGGRMDYFHTTAGGSFKAVGTGTSVIGFGAGKLRPEFGGAIVIDDPIKPLDVKSPTVRKTCVDHYTGSLQPRRNRIKKPYTPIVLIMQRLHPQDLVGYVIGQERDDWTVITLPAIDEDTGLSIWEDRISLAYLNNLKLDDPDKYWAQYMQAPSDAMTRIFHDDWWRYWNNREEIERKITLKIITADTAFKDKDSNDFSVLQCWGFENTGAAYLLDQRRDKWEFPELCDNFKDFIRLHTHKLPRNWTPATEAWIEDRASGTSLVQSFRKESIPVNEWLPPNADQKIIDKSEQFAAPGKDKVARANQCTNPIRVGRVRLPYPGMPGCRWVEGFINEHSVFSKDDSHLYDDQVDTGTMALLIWQQRGGAVGSIPKYSGENLVWPPNREKLAA